MSKSRPFRANIKHFPLTPEQRIKLEFAIRHHTDGKVSNDPTIGACWEADRLALGRAGITPAPTE